MLENTVLNGTFPYLRCNLSLPVQPRHRPTASILVLNNHNQVLLLEIADPDTPPVHFRVTPGAGVEPSETFEDAAKRALFEETGFVVAGVGKAVWQRRKPVFFGGDWVDADELTFVVRVSFAEVVHDNQLEQERMVIRNHRWWSLEELRTTSDTVFPENLAHHLEPILNGEPPSNPIDISPENTS
jgi:8-oxo-dGTP pyrophosphatase MutT (NUDIX family)